MNKLNTKATIRFDLKLANWLNAEVKERLIKKFPSKVSAEVKEGDPQMFVIHSQNTRSQGQNLKNALDKLQSYVD